MIYPLCRADRSASLPPLLLIAPVVAAALLTATLLAGALPALLLAALTGLLVRLIRLLAALLYWALPTLLVPALLLIALPVAILLHDPISLLDGRHMCDRDAGERQGNACAMAILPAKYREVRRERGNV